MMKPSRLALNGREAFSGSSLRVDRACQIGVIFGAGIGGIHTFEEEVGNYYTRQEMGPKFNPFFIPKIPKIRAHHCQQE